MNILSVDTSTEALGLCLAQSTEENLFSRFETRTLVNGSQHSEKLIPEILELCERNKLRLQDIDLLVCTNGPGSFTGLRIGMSSCKGIALAAGIPLVSVSTMDAIYEGFSFFDGAVVPAIDARKNRFYSAVFAEGKRQTPDLDCAGEELAKLLEGYERTLVIGPDAKAFARQLGTYRGKLIVDGNPSANLALILVRIGLEKFRTVGADDIGTGPAYVRKSDAEIALQEKIRKSEEVHG
ncbi:tRNA (adenosine(37)-N6)-threonylcarbamoyltransferase complex dimerization subunit type 1 TsaB [uncultured Sphaerochaeta sp.]|uniref:tRNA (adenosine(37)-N6)-threonylcarbamoyltransferase complex dimerization subunit type 1 TsaB n=1 Tax=uncultured Sphaerochaeta sp. TaxID=886478 RepID=UPI002A0A2CE5|nr:tRNA (adenosine(37)-N6)-threonylcarbamoyltransferase complex dimerization subunit type 1 TsaB [uncultured Sphaerochaeta sp.]